MDADNLSRKERHALHFDWTHLLECCLEQGRAVTAHEYARFMGIARSTAQRRLVALVETETAVTYRSEGRNGYPKITYEPSGKGETWSYTYGDFDLPNDEAL